jgi:hypothetical protein
MYSQSAGQHMMPPSSFKGSPTKFDNKYKRCIELCQKLRANNDLGSIETKTELHVLQIRERFIPFHQNHLFLHFNFISYVTNLLSYQW